MRKTTAIKLAAKSYWLIAIFGSFTHVQLACTMLGANSWERWVAPIMVDGMFLISMLMRHEDWCQRTQRIGFWVMVSMGSISLAGNVFAATATWNTFGFIFGVFLPGAMLLGEWLSDKKQLKTAKQETDELAAADAQAIVEAASAQIAACTHPKTCATAAQCATKTSAALKAGKTRKRAARQRTMQAKALEELVNA